MKREFTDLLIQHFDRTLTESDGRFGRAKSASKGGGVTFRRMVAGDSQILLGFETIAQRDMICLFVAWAKGKKIPNLNTLEEVRVARGPFIDDPVGFVSSSDQGFLNACDLGQSINTLELEPLWVPADVVLRRIKIDAKLAQYVSDVLQFDSARPGDAPAPMLSWEQYFLLQDRSIESAPSVSDVLAPMCLAMTRQLKEVFIPFSGRIETLLAR